MGFTLLELLVAMSVLSLVSLLMLGGLRFGARVWQRSEAISEDTESIETAQNFIRNLLATAYPEWEEDRQAGPHVFFDGEINRVTFLAPPPRQFGLGPNIRFNFGLSVGGDLTVSWDAGAFQSDNQPTAAILLHGVQSIEFAYYGRDLSGKTLVWSSTWSNRASIPKLIRLRMAFTRNDRRIWPDLIVHPQITADVKCIYDPISRGCRGRPE